jgi:hypothetical protein
MGAVIEEFIDIGAEPETVFDLSQDYGRRLEWDPFLRSMRFEGGETNAGVGVRVTVRAWHGLGMTVELVSFDRPRVVAMKMVKGPWFLRSFAGSWRFREVESPRHEKWTRATMRYVFEVNPRWLAPVLTPLARGVFRRDVRSRLRGLQRGAAGDSTQPACEK